MADENYPGEKIYVAHVDLLKILYIARDKIHEGHKLMTHPLSGSIKPGQTYYKSIVITKDKGDLDTESLKIIESSIAVAESMLKDFQLIDFELIKSGM